jgi:hypothetical protein
VTTAGGVSIARETFSVVGLVAHQGLPTQVTVPMLTEPTSAQREAFTLIGTPIPLTLT